MYMSTYLAPTTRETPADAEIISHQLLLRAGYIRRVSSGIYNYLPLMTRVIKKVVRIVQEEMDATGAQEIVMPVLQPSEYWEESGRLHAWGKELMRLKDRHDRLNLLGPTHEEVVTIIARNEVRSYRQLPVNLYQIQVKFRDEIRPRFGLLRCREFLMKDAYSFHVDEASLEKTYQAMSEAYARIFRRCGLDTRMVESDVGAIGGSSAHEFMVIVETEAGESHIAFCKSCEYAATDERAEGAPDYLFPQETPADFQVVDTPATTDIASLASLLHIHANRICKHLLYKADDHFVGVALPGGVLLNEVKLKNYLQATELRLANDDEVERLTGSSKGFVNVCKIEPAIQVVGDRSLAQLANFTIALNQADKHAVNANWGRDFQLPALVDLHLAQEGDRCPRCQAGTLFIRKGIEVGNIFKLGTKYSTAMNAVFTDGDSQPKPFVMGCYGLGVTRTIQAAIERFHDKDGILWPVAIAPFQVVVTPVNTADPDQLAAAEKLYRDCLAQGLEAIFDDRAERAGVKFKDADLLGFPVRLTVGRDLADGLVEIKFRPENRMEKVSLDQAVATIRAYIQEHTHV